MASRTWSRMPWPPGLLLSRPQGVARARVVAALTALQLASCGGGGSGTVPASSSGTPNAASSAPAAADVAVQRRTTVAQRVYLGIPRVPADFVLDAAPAGATGPVATAHLKSSDVGSPSSTPRHELCSNDAAEALGWSEQRASWQGSYSDLVETNVSGRVFEFVRVPRVDTTARLRHRVFKCSYLDRSGTDLDADAGAAGLLQPMPVGVDALRTVAEYLWQFTAFNNADHVVLSSSAAAMAGGQVVWQIEMARLSRGATSVDCDRIDRLAWTHTADSASGAMTRRLETLESFRARRENGVVQLCTN